MDDLESKAKRLDVKPLIAHYMDRLSVRQLLEKHIPKTPQMQLAPADALSRTQNDAAGGLRGRRRRVMEG